MQCQKTHFQIEVQLALYGERPTKYFLNLEKRNTKERTLTSLLTEGEEVVTESKRILEVAREFYVNLYKSQEEQLIPGEALGDEMSELNLPQLSEED